MHLLVLLVLPLVVQEEAEKGIQAEQFRSHIEFLASDDLKGRNNNTPESELAIAYIIKQMKEIGLDSAGTKGFRHEFSIQRKRGPLKGVNVVGKLSGNDAKLRDEVIVIVAHHDGLGIRKGEIHNGADDNASGVAMLLELAQACAVVRDRIPRTLVFASFDCEEDGLVGSHVFLRDKVVDPETIVANICFDLIGGNFFKWETNTIYGLGSETNPVLSNLLRKNIDADQQLTVSQTSIAVIEPMGVPRSDYASFRKKGIPFVFFSTATPWYYHRPADDVDIINFPKIQKAGRFCFRFLLDLAKAEKISGYQKPEPAIHGRDLEFLAANLERLIAKKRQLKISEKDLKKAESLSKKLSAAMKENDMNRKTVGLAQSTLVFLFTVAKKQNPQENK